MIVVKEGSWYRRRDGEIKGPAKFTDRREFPFEVDGYTYTIDGRWNRHPENLHYLDLIEEVDAPPAINQSKHVESAKPETCKTCRFWQDFNSMLGQAYGRCKEKSPRMNENGYAVWPNVAGDEWCGRYEPYTDQLLDKNGDMS